MSDKYYECSECGAVNLGAGACPTCKAASELAPARGSVAGPTIADAIAEYKATRGSSAVKLLHRVLDKIIGLKCPHCGKDVPVKIESH